MAVGRLVRQLGSSTHRSAACAVCRTDSVQVRFDRMVSGAASSTDDLLSAAEAGSVRAIARLLSRIESGGDRAADVARALVGRPRHATIIGITGPPGVGKSTLSNALIGRYRSAGPPGRGARRRPVEPVQRRSVARRSGPDGRARDRPRRLHPLHVQPRGAGRPVRGHPGGRGSVLRDRDSTTCWSKPSASARTRSR